MRNIFLAHNRLERHYLRLIAVSIILPTLIISGCLYYVIFNLMAEQLGIPEVIAYHLLPVVKNVNVILLIALPVLFTALFSIGVILTRRFVGPIERLENELKEISISGDKSRRLQLRKGDALTTLVERINGLLDSVNRR